MGTIVHAQGHGIAVGGTTGGIVSVAVAPVTDDMNLSGRKIIGSTLQAYGSVVNAMGETGGGTKDIDLNLGNMVTATVTTSANTFTFSNPLSLGNATEFTMVLTNGGSQTVTWPGTVLWDGGVAPTLTASGKDVLSFMTLDAGATWFGFFRLNLAAASLPGAVTIGAVFSVSDYTGTGAAKTITNSINLSTYGGLVWLKSRSDVSNNLLYDTARTATYQTIANTTDIQTVVAQGLTSFTTSGFVLGTDTGLNNLNSTYASFTFRKSPRFFDVVPFTFANQLQGHNLGCTIGTIIIKPLNYSMNAYVATRATNGFFQLETTASAFGTNAAGIGDSSAWIPANNVMFNPKNFCSYGVQYVAYLFAHDATATGVIQSGSFTTDGNGAATVTGLPHIPQFCIMKCASSTGGWIVVDTTRGWGAGNDKTIQMQSTGAEVTSVDIGAPTSDGFTVAGLTVSQTYIYISVAGA